MISEQQQRAGFQPLRGLAIVLTVLLAAVLAAIAARLAIQLLGYDGGHGRQSLIGIRLDQAADITIFVLGLVFIVWLHRARINAEHCDYRQRRAPAWAFWGWIIPIVNLWFPFQMMGDIWRAGLPAEQWRKTAWPPALWWTCWLLSGLSFGAQAASANSGAVPRLGAGTDEWSLCFLALAGAMLITIIRTVSAGPVGSPPR